MKYLSLFVYVKCPYIRARQQANPGVVVEEAVRGTGDELLEASRNHWSD
jgi:hypothetical protein